MASISLEGKIGIGLALLFGVGAGAVAVWPETKEIGWTIIYLSVSGLLFLALHHWHEKTKHKKMVPLVGGIVFAVASIVCFGWYYFHTQTNPISKATEAQPTAEPKKLSISLVVTHGEKQFRFYNAGKSNLYFWGFKFGGDARTIAASPMTLPPSMILTAGVESLEAQALKNLEGKNGYVIINSLVFLADDDSSRFKGEFSSKITVRNGVVAEVSVGVIDIQPDWDPFPPTNLPNPYASWTNQKLKNEIASLAQELRAADQDKRTISDAEFKLPFDARNRKLDEINAKAREEYQSKFYSKVYLINEELLRRLKLPKPELSVPGLPTIYLGELFGANPLSAIANYLESLSLRLPD